jgi:hypothetical protein
MWTLDRRLTLAALFTARWSLYGYLVTNGAFTPAANSEVYTPGLRLIDA